jgi:hypothetical protein
MTDLAALIREPDDLGALVVDGGELVWVKYASGDWARLSNDPREDPWVRSWEGIVTEYGVKRVLPRGVVVLNREQVARATEPVCNSHRLISPDGEQYLCLCGDLAVDSAATFRHHFTGLLNDALIAALTGPTARMETLIERSSLGTPEAKALRASVSDEDAARVMARVHELEAQQPSPAAEGPCSRCGTPVEYHAEWGCPEFTAEVQP